MINLFRKILTYSFIRFGIVGVINTLIDFLLFFTLHNFFDWHIIPANITSFTIAVSNSYLLNKYWSFSYVDTGKFSLSQFCIFVLTSIIALLLNTSILIFGEPYLDIVLLKIIGAIAIPLLNFSLYKFVVFIPIK